jgi:hypothetical protein
MSMNDDFGAPDEAPGSDRSQTPEDATLHGQPIEDQPGIGEASSADPDIAGSGSTLRESQLADPSRLGEGLPDSDDL